MNRFFTFCRPSFALFAVAITTTSLLPATLWAQQPTPNKIGAGVVSAGFAMAAQESAQESASALEGGEFLSEAEEEESEIETDRDSFTPATSTVAWGRTVFESAYSFIDNPEAAETHSFPEVLVRHGLTERLELRLGWNYEIGGAGNPISGNTSGAEFHGEEELEESSRLLYGAKWKMTDQLGYRPDSAVILQGFTPTFGESNLTQMSATHVFGWQLPNEWVWDFSNRFGTSGEAEDHFNTWSTSSVVKIPIGERWKAHAEYFGIFSDGREIESVQHYFSPGVHYLIHEDLEIGIRVGWGMNDQSADFFSNVGFGWQF